MRRQIVAGAAFGDEGAQLDVLPHHFLGTHVRRDGTNAFHHPVIRHLGRVGDVGEDGVFHIAVDGFQNRIMELET